jgi:predicted permease
LTGALLGLGLAQLARPLVPLLQLPVTDFDLRLDGRVLLLSFAVSQLTALLFGLAPALAAARRSPADVLRDTTAGGRLLPRRILAAAQVALATLLAIGAGLFLRTMANFGGDRLGFQPGHVLAASVDLGYKKYPTGAVTPFYDELTRRLAALPGALAVSRTSHPPYTSQLSWAIFPEGESRPDLEKGQNLVIFAGEDYFRTLGIPLQAGRDFTPRDGPEAPGIAVVNQAMAKLVWPGQSPLGKRIRLDAKESPFEVIGVAGNTSYFQPRRSNEPILYLSHRQFPRSELGQYFANQLTLLVRTSGPPAGLARAVRSQVRALDPGLPVENLAPLQEKIDSATAHERRSAQLLTALAGLALLLTAVGVYGVLAATVTQRTREIGIRMALGEDRPAILGRILRSALLLAALGVLAGAAAAFWLTAFLRNQLFGIAPTDPWTFTGAALLLLAVAFLAALLPALRATRVQPAAALRNQ